MKKHAGHRPTEVAEVNGTVGIGIIVWSSRHTAAECKHLLVQIVGDHQQNSTAGMIAKAPILPVRRNFSDFPRDSAIYTPSSGIKSIGR